MKNAAQRLAKRAQKKERMIVATFAAMAEAAGMTPAQVAASTVMVYADVRSKPARVAAWNMNPSPEVRSAGPRVITAADRGRVVSFMRDGGPKAPEADALAAMLQSPPQEGFFWLLCLAGAPGDRMISFSLSMVAWSVYGAYVQQGEMPRGDALALWHEIERQHPGFWDDYARGHDGPVTDNDRVEMVRAGCEYGRQAGQGAN